MKLISDTVEYALRSILWLMQHPERLQTTRQIAAGTRIPADYQSKVLQLLAKAGIVRGQRGIGGGFRLEPGCEEWTILDVLNAVDPLQRIHACPLNLEEHADCLCPLHSGLNSAVEQVEASFARTRIADLLAHESASIPLGIRREHCRAVFPPSPAGSS